MTSLSDADTLQYQTCSQATLSSSGRVSIAPTGVESVVAETCPYEVVTRFLKHDAEKASDVDAHVMRRHTYTEGHRACIQFETATIESKLIADGMATIASEQRDHIAYLELVRKREKEVMRERMQEAVADTATCNSAPLSDVREDVMPMLINDSGDASLTVDFLFSASKGKVNSETLLTFRALHWKWMFSKSVRKVGVRTAILLMFDNPRTKFEKRNVKYVRVPTSMFGTPLVVADKVRTIIRDVERMFPNICCASVNNIMDALNSDRHLTDERAEAGMNTAEEAERAADEASHDGEDKPFPKNNDHGRNQKTMVRSTLSVLHWVWG
eukprot:GHVU01122284.1.p1 GENE.GHVU01122284.1~~GHVU01122284.1.p1  ORF type:complete len:365 (-),score=12.95 GHVU01122284.1:217-1197(-)